MARHITVSYVQDRILAGARLNEIGAEFGMKPDAMTAFCAKHNLSAFSDGSSLPPRDLSRPDRVSIYRSKMDPVSGARRITRISLPRISMYVSQLEAQR
ncbi:hypothetical protein AAIH46_18070 [Rhizobium sp. 0TCS1.26]|uniref:hypothetical protein n=1 Tax=Rhizobium sp. 0TCS1.26 TaxID=3142623 RepID=UPI003D26B14F